MDVYRAGLHVHWTTTSSCFGSLGNSCRVLSVCFGLSCRFRLLAIGVPDSCARFVVLTVRIVCIVASDRECRLKCELRGSVPMSGVKCGLRGSVAIIDRPHMHACYLGISVRTLGGEFRTSLSVVVLFFWTFMVPPIFLIIVT